ncbi:MAG TPA: 4-(cytidine 5'-diphospho)-2-C-methyl-D-erythritol kinase [Burkholderiales bacterium]|nr:4-(cytidine 5'-diphospho)-2-C-methyl-D-erythritol kinase [Burkholderiales bacterium]
MRHWYPAPGKLNLFLHVLSKRADGYHELQTVFRLIDRCDRVRIAKRDDGEVRFSGPFGEDNLCVKAARLLKQQTSTRLGCDLALEKSLPIGGGLGGGSSDAATVLWVLNREWRLGLSTEELLPIGKKLGADVPFFLMGRNALGEGIGEQLTPLDLPPAWYVVIDPQVSVSTREIFQSALTHRGKRLKIPPFFPGQGANDLEPVVTARFPAVAASLAWLRQHRPQARMTGSGACVFAEFEDEGAARAVYSKLPGGMRGFVARGLEQHPLFERLGLLK